MLFPPAFILFYRDIEFERALETLIKRPRKPGIANTSVHSYHINHKSPTSRGQ